MAKLVEFETKDGIKIAVNPDLVQAVVRKDSVVIVLASGLTYTVTETFEEVVEGLNFGFCSG